MSGYPSQNAPGTASPAVWNRRLGARFDPNGPAAHKQRFAFFRMTRLRDLTVPLPSSVDLRQGFGPVTNQIYNSCVAESLTAAYNYMARRAVGFNPIETGDARLFVYYQARAIDGVEDRDEGAFIGSGAQALVSGGICEEKFHSYTAGPFVKPPKEAYANALDHRAISVRMVDQNLDAIKELLASGLPVTIGFLVFPSIQTPEVEKSGDIPLPSTQERNQPPLGGHAVVICGYDDAQKRFFIRNSWGTKWGRDGYGSLPYDYLIDNYLSQDFWVILGVNDESIPNVVPEQDPWPSGPEPWPQPSVSGECCSSCDPVICCCARTRLSKKT